MKEFGLDFEAQINHHWRCESGGNGFCATHYFEDDVNARELFARYGEENCHFIQEGDVVHNGPLEGVHDHNSTTSWGAGCQAKERKMEIGVTYTVFRFPGYTTTLPVTELGWENDQA